MSDSGIMSNSTLISIKVSNNSSFIVLLDLFFIIFNLPNLNEKMLVRSSLRIQERVRIYFYVKYKFENAEVRKLYLYKYLTMW